MWKSCSNILPIRTKLFDRKVISNYSCPVCGEEAETINHMFMECSVALAVWDKHSNLKALFQSGMCFVDWVEEILTNCLPLILRFSSHWFGLFGGTAMKFGRDRTWVK